MLSLRGRAWEGHVFAPSATSVDGGGYFVDGQGIGRSLALIPNFAAVAYLVSKNFVQTSTVAIIDSPPAEFTHH